MLNIDHLEHLLIAATFDYCLLQLVSKGLNCLTFELLLFLQVRHARRDEVTVLTQLLVGVLFFRHFRVAFALAPVVVLRILLHFLLDFVEDVLVVGLQAVDLFLYLAKVHPLKNAVGEMNQVGVANLRAHLLQT